MITNMANLTVPDAAVTPISHTFGPASRVDGNTARWLDREHYSGAPIGYAQVTYTLKEPSFNLPNTAASNQVYRHTVKLTRPILDTSGAFPVLLGVGRATVEFSFPVVMSEQDRKDMLAMTRNILFPGSGNALGDNITTQSLPY